MKFNKKILVIVLLLISILSIGIVSASENVSTDINCADAEFSDNIYGSDLAVDNLDSSEGICDDLYSLNDDLGISNDVNSDMALVSDNNLNYSYDDVSNTYSGKILNYSSGNLLNLYSSNDLNCFSDNDLNQNSKDLKPYLGSNQLSIPISNFDLLQLYINRASDGDTINVSYKYYGSGNQITISKSLTLVGNGGFLDANGLSRILKISSSNVTLKNITFKNAFTNNSGGAIYILNSTCTLINCTFINCSSDNTGGAVIFYNSTGFVSGSDFINCSAYYGGAIRTNNGNCSILNSRFHCLNSKTNGGIVNFYDSNCSVYGSEFKSSGTAFYLSNCVSSLENCSFIDCSTKSSLIGSNYDENDNPIISKGVFYSYNSSSSLDNCSFIDCYSYNGAIIFYNESNSSLDNCNFIDSESLNIYAINSSTSMFNSSIINCSNGAIFSRDSDSIISDCSFIDSHPTAYALREFEFVHGIIFSLNSKFYIVNSSFLNCTNSIYSDSNCSVVNCTFLKSYNENYEYSSAIYFTGKNNTVNDSTFRYCFNNGTRGQGTVLGANVYNSSFINCSGTLEYFGNGGALFDSSAYDCSFINCSAAYGGAASADADNCTVYNCSFLNCFASIWGGAMYGVSSINCSFINCSSDMYAGAIFAGSAYQSSFINCFTNGSGGAISGDHDEGKRLNLLVDSCSFKKCSAGLTGGAVYGYGSPMTLYNSSFLDCSANDYGGGASSCENTTNCSFINCRASYGGAMDSMLDKVNIFDCIFRNCSAKDYSGAIDLLYCIDVNIGNCSFLDCSSVWTGGALGIERVKNTHIFGCSFIRCSSKEFGAAIFSNLNKNFSISYCSFVKCRDPYNNIVPDDAKITNCYFSNPISTKLFASALTMNYGVSKSLVITLKDKYGNLIKGRKITIKLAGVSKTLTTNNKGQVSLLVSKLIPKTYTATINFLGDNNYTKSCKSVKVVVKKLTPVLTATKKTFKRTLKTKTYSVSLRNNKNKVMKNCKITVKVNGKSYSAKTNANGVARFKLNLNKKGTFKATVSYSGSAYYSKVSKSVSILIK